uniref:Uncharacterized protein n=1 Tax=Parascaris equorum TaxID=6256 RepID=A0A914R5T1_PAREQ
MITELLRPQKRPTAEHLVEQIDDLDADDGAEYFVDQKEGEEEEDPRDESGSNGGKRAA